MSGTTRRGADIGGTIAHAAPDAGGAPAFAEAFAACATLAEAVAEGTRRAGAEPSRLPEWTLGAAPPARALGRSRPSPRGPEGPASVPGDPRAWPVIAGPALRGRAAAGRAGVDGTARTVGRPARAGRPR